MQRRNLVVCISSRRLLLDHREAAVLLDSRTNTIRGGNWSRGSFRVGKKESEKIAREGGGEWTLRNRGGSHGCRVVFGFFSSRRVGKLGDGLDRPASREDQGCSRRHLPHTTTLSARLAPFFILFDNLIPRECLMAQPLEEFFATFISSSSVMLTRFPILVVIRCE